MLTNRQISEAMNIQPDGALPPMPAFYHRPQTIGDLINQTLGKVLDCFDIPHNLFKRWGLSPTPETGN